MDIVQRISRVVEVEEMQVMGEILRSSTVCLQPQAKEWKFVSKKESKSLKKCYKAT